MSIVPAGDGKLLLQKYDLRIVTNTKDVVRETHLTPDKTATLVGNPRFLLSDDNQLKAIAAFRAPAAKPVGAEPVLLASAPANPMSGVRSRDLEQRSADCPERPAGGFLCPLPYTAAEIATIGGLLSEKSWVVTTYHDEGALEEAVKAARHPRLLHVATHGFFLSDQQGHNPERSTGREDPMLRSGLLLAGADRVFKNGRPLADADDGVLTAYEVSSLDLNGTALVVLSACETGLGETRAGEGVFGLRRAFEVAGAESVLMSMWKVPDRETSDLMSSFYTKWLGGMEKHEALRTAQMELRQKIINREGHDIPYFWGAWVLVGK
jgi:CHAT domain-containing protein